MIFVVAAQGRADGCYRLGVGVTGEISVWVGRSDGGQQEERVHELSRPIEGTGQNWGWQPGSKVSTMIMRPPQQGQGFRSSSACPPSVPSLSLLDEAGSGMARSWRADAMLLVRLPFAKKP